MSTQSGHTRNMSMLNIRSWRLLAASIGICGLLIHIVSDALPTVTPVDGAFAVRSLGADTPAKLTFQQVKFLIELKAARASGILSGERRPISVKDFSDRYDVKLASADGAIKSARNGLGLDGSGSGNDPSGDSTADDCIGCLSEYNPLKFLITVVEMGQMTRAEGISVFLPPCSDPKWSRAHMLFHSRAPPLSV